MEPVLSDSGNENRPGEVEQDIGVPLDSDPPTLSSRIRSRSSRSAIACEYSMLRALRAPSSVVNIDHHTYISAVKDRRRVPGLALDGALARVSCCRHPEQYGSEGAAHVVAYLTIF